MCQAAGSCRREVTNQVPDLEGAGEMGFELVCGNVSNERARGALGYGTVASMEAKFAAVAVGVLFLAIGSGYASFGRLNCSLKAVEKNCGSRL